MIYAYCRVSTAHQTEENQHFVIENFAKENNLNIDIWVEETISSGQKLSKRFFDIYSVKLWFMFNVYRNLMRYVAKLIKKTPFSCEKGVF